MQIKTSPRYTAARKAAILAAIQNGEITADEACAEHNITGEELEGWAKSLRRSGQQGLRITRLQHYREG